MKGSIFKEHFWVKLAAKDYFQLGGLSYGEKGLDLKKFFGGPILKIGISNAFIFIFLFVEVQEPRWRGNAFLFFLIEFQEPQSFF